MRRLSLLLSVASLGVAPVAHAQADANSTAAPLKDKEAVVFKEIERGFFLGVSAGPFFVLNPPAQDGTPRPFSSGQMAQIGLGFDLGERVSVELFAFGSANRAGSDYVGKATGNKASGDFATLIPGAAVRVNILGLADFQNTPRTWFYLRGGAGRVLFFPKDLLPDSDVMVFAGPGVEYYTRLRHFSIGLEVSGKFWLSSGTLGITVAPNLRYAF